MILSLNYNFNLKITIINVNYNIMSFNGQDTSHIRVQTHFSLKVCPKNTSFYGKRLGINLTQIDKFQGQNQGIFTFEFTPILLKLQKVNISNYFSLNCDSVPFKVKSWNFTEGKAIALVDYYADMESHNVSINFTFDQFFIHPPIVYPLDALSHGAKLLYSGEGEKMDKISIIILSGVSYLSVFLVLLGSWAHRTAGVQLMHTLQIIYQLHFSLAEYSKYQYPFQQLSLVVLNSRLLNYGTFNFLPQKNDVGICFNISLISLFIIYAFIRFIKSSLFGHDVIFIVNFIFVVLILAVSIISIFRVAVPVSTRSRPFAVSPRREEVIRSTPN